MEGERSDQKSQGDENKTSCSREEAPTKDEDGALPPETGPAGDSCTSSPSANIDIGDATTTTTTTTDTNKPSATKENGQEISSSLSGQDSDNENPRQEPTIQEPSDGVDTTTITENSEVTRPKCLHSPSDRQGSWRQRSLGKCKGTKNGESKATTDVDDRSGNPSLKGVSRKTNGSDKTNSMDSTFFSPSKAYCWICLEQCKLTTQGRVERVGRLCLCCACPSSYTEPDLSSPCGCTGSLQYVHRTCLRRWVREQGSHSCRICNEYYHIPPAQSLCQRLSEEGMVGTCCPSLRSHANTVLTVTLLVLFVGVVSTLGYSTANTYMELKKQSIANPEDGASTMIILVFGLSLSLLIVLTVLMCVYVTCLCKIYYRNRHGSYSVPTGEEFMLDEIIQIDPELQSLWNSLPPEVREIALQEGFIIPTATVQMEASPPEGSTSSEESTPPEESTLPEESTPPEESTQPEESIPPEESTPLEETPLEESQEVEVTPSDNSDETPNPNEPAVPSPASQESSDTQRTETITVEV